MGENDVVAARLTVLRNELLFLKREVDLAGGLEAYSADPRLRRAVERSLQVDTFDQYAEAIREHLGR